MQITQYAMKASLKQHGLTALLLLAGLTACNKDKIELVPPPYSVYPNPFIDAFSIYTQNLPAGQSTVFRLYTGENGSPREIGPVAHGSAIIVSTDELEPGVYHLEAEIAGKQYSLPILKAE